MTARLALVLAVTVVSGLAAAPDARAQRVAGEAAFLTIPSGARIVAAGRAAVAVEDPAAAFYNPAAGAWVASLSVALNRYDGPLGFRTHRGTLVLPVGRSGVLLAGAQVQTFGTFALAADDGPAVPYEPQNAVFELGWGHRLGDVVLGARGKWVDSRVAPDAGGSGGGVDAGAAWRVLGGPVTLGAAVLDAGPDLRLGRAGGAVPLPTRVRFGASARFRPSRDIGLGVAVDGQTSPREAAAFSRFAGGNLELFDALTLRGGWVRERLVETHGGATFGVGLRVGSLRFDLGRELGVNQLGDETHISLEFRR